ncbi:MAG: hypothetical protein SFY69_09205 [Planctomycetota bacterium]|nr:hypothetical protein [Planctomycetota bacterium]
MAHTNRSVRRMITIATLLAAAGSACGQAVGTAFTYQGSLSDAGTPSSGFHDLRFQLYTESGSPVGPLLCSNDVLLGANGQFTVSLDFGSAFLGDLLSLEIQVRADAGQTLPCANTTGFTVLAPRQTLNPTPNAMWATNASTAANASAAINSTNLNGQPASFYQNANNLTNGSLPSSRFSGTYASQVNLSNPANLFSGAFTGSGAALTQLNASNIASGTLDVSRLPAVVARTNIVQSWSAQQTFQTQPFFTSPGFPFAVSSNGLVTNLNADLLDGLHSSAFALVAHTHTAADIASGTLVDARLSSNVALLNRANAFGNFPNTFLGSVGVGTASPSGKFEVASGGGSFVRVTTGNGDIEYNGGLDGVMVFTNTIATGSTSFVKSDGSPQLVINHTNGRVGIGTSTPTAPLDVRGAAATPGTFTVTPGQLFGVTNSVAVTLDTPGVGVIGVSDNFLVNNGLTVNGTSTFSHANFNSIGVSSTGVVANLNADLLDGQHASAFLTSIPVPLTLSGSVSAAGTINGTNTRLDGIGIQAISTGTDGIALLASATGDNPLGVAIGVRAETADQNGIGIHARATHSAGANTGLQAETASSSVNAAAIRAFATNGARGLVAGSTSSEAVLATSSTGTAIRANATNGGRGVVADSTSSEAVLATSITGTAVRGVTNTGGTAVYGERAANGNKGWFGGAGEGAWAESPTGVGLVALSGAAGGAAIYCRNDGGGLAINCDGEAQVRVLTIVGGSDVAEPFDVAASLATDTTTAVQAIPGMVVSIDPANPGALVVSTTAYDTKVAGIISGANGLAPGLTLRAIDQQHADGDHPVAMTGRVWCYVDTSFGAIEPGDRLTSSQTPGHAMKVRPGADASGSVIGKAMTPLAQGEKGMVLVLVNLQ